MDSTGNSAQCHVTAWMGGEIGVEWIHINAESMGCPPEIITVVLIGYTPV